MVESSALAEHDHESRLRAGSSGGQSNGLLLLKPHRRRQLAEEHRARLVAACTAALRKHREGNVQGDFPDREATQTGGNDPEAARWRQ